MLTARKSVAQQVQVGKYEESPGLVSVKGKLHVARGGKHVPTCNARALALRLCFH